MGPTRSRLAATRRLAFALAWKLFVLIETISFAVGALVWLLPGGQMSFWIASEVSAVVGPLAGDEAVGQVLEVLPWAFRIGCDLLGFALLFVALNVLLAWHAGRSVGRSAPVTGEV